VCVQAKLLRAHPHAHVIATHEPFGTRTEAYLPMELCERDLFAGVEAEGPLPEQQARVVFGQVVSALQHCEGLGVYHGDVKPENVLLVRGLAVLADFGSSKTKPHTSKGCSTLQYGAPEAVAMLRGGEGGRTHAYSVSAADVWALGVSMAAVLSGFMPWDVAHSSDARYNYWAHACDGSSSGGDVTATGVATAPLRDAADKLIFGGCDVVPSPALLSLLCGMLHPSPAHRLTLAGVAAHAWFAEA
jgi:serine/threonine protein kinase